MKRRYQFWFAITALHKLGAVAIPATHLLTDEDIVYRCQSASIRAIVAVGDDVVLDHIQKAAPDCPSVKNYISIGPKVPEGWCDFNAGIESAPPFVRPEVVNEPGDISLMYFTSGTSGEPKMVAHDFRYPLGHIITAKYWHNLDENSLHFTLADTGWGKAVWGKYYGQWIVGANVFVYDFEKFHPVDVLEMIHKFHITSFCAPPTVYRFLIREDVKKYDISSLKYCTNAGEALNPNVFERWYELTGIKLHEAFGQTETTATVGTYPWIEPRPGSMGKPNPGYDIDLITADGQVAEDGQQGEIIIRTHGRRPEGLFLGYYRDPELTHKNFHDGIYHTGDIAWRDEDGYYWFVGRKDDVIKSSGYRIGPFEVENALMKHEAVVECAVTGVPDEVRGMAVKATVVLSKEFADTPGIEYDVEYRGKEVPALVKDIQDFVKRTTAPYKYPRVIQFVRELPKTISGKIRRVEIRQKDGERS
ncbi:MAG: AMP-binding protein, partial [Sodaliphilus sp.]|nr:AMP-binding protein [Sodaliphilus sp.]